KDPVQIVHRKARLPWAMVDLRQLSTTEQNEHLERLLTADRERGFDLPQPPLMRYTILQTGDDCFHFAWSYHHLLLDGWSTDLVIKETLALYRAFCHGVRPQLEQRHPYRNYIAWLQRQGLSKAEKFWREYLKGFSAPNILKFSVQANGQSRYNNTH